MAPYPETGRDEARRVEQRKSAVNERGKIMDTRVQASFSLLRADVRRFRDALPAAESRPPIRHHVAEFYTYCASARDTLFARYVHAGTDPDDRRTFEALITGTLSAWWMILRAVAAQRLEHHPYAADLRTLDGHLYERYDRLRAALRHHHVPVDDWGTPVLYVGELTEIVMFNDPRAPALISVPLGAIEKPDQNWPPIAHELGHLMAARLHALIPELHAKFDAGPDADGAAPRSLGLPWLPEIVADLVGVALGGEEFVKSAIDVNTLPQRLLDVMDFEHPIALIRPYVQLVLLKRLDPEAYERQITRYNALAAPFLNERIEQVDPLLPVTLDQVRVMVEGLTEDLLTAKVRALRKHSLLDMLTSCYRPEAPQPASEERKETPAHWGTIPDDMQNTFELRRPRAYEEGAPWYEPIVTTVQRWGQSVSKAVNG